MRVYVGGDLLSRYCQLCFFKDNELPNFLLEAFTNFTRCFMLIALTNIRHILFKEKLSLLGKNRIFFYSSLKTNTNFDVISVKFKMTF